MRFASIGSGSDGNGLVVEAGTTRVLMDCGFSLTETRARLAQLGLAPEDLDAVVVTHEHSDHIGGVARLAARYELPVWCTHGTWINWRAQTDALPWLEMIDPHRPFSVGELEIQPFAVPHDAREPVQFVFRAGARMLGVLTDAGHVTPHIAASLSGVQALVLECNHDAGMLSAGPYPPSLKRRVGGQYGHLENRQAAALLKQIDVSGLRHVIAAHLSQKNNTPELARGALAEALGCEADWIEVACQDGGFDWRHID
ncbi:MBL fold metallo-hydrolase [Betaproteobacteria bacterium SCN2]|nr:MBL fold metallo-hydrolase [Betaproteobacteria bacterium SCN2]